MKAQNLLPSIRKAIPSDENPTDVVTMIDLLASARAAAAGRSPMEKDYRFAGKILCVSFDPVKTQAYRAELRLVRTHFRGISQDSTKAKRFTVALSNTLAVENFRKAVGTPVHKLFAIESKLATKRRASSVRSRWLAGSRQKTRSTIKKIKGPRWPRDKED